MVFVIHAVEPGRVNSSLTLKEDHGDNMGVAGGLNDNAAIPGPIEALLSQWFRII